MKDYEKEKKALLECLDMCETHILQEMFGWGKRRLEYSGPKDPKPEWLELLDRCHKMQKEVKELP